MEIINFIGGIFNILWSVLKFIGTLIKNICAFCYISFDFIISTLGIKTFPLKALVFILYSCVLLTIVDIISYFGCRLNSKYWKLKTKEERHEYTSKHTHFLLNLFLDLKNKKRQKESLNKPDNNIVYSDINTDNIIQDLSSNNEENSLTSNLDNHVQNENNNAKSNIKLLYSSSIIGKMLRKDVVLDRKLLSSDKPVLVDFTGIPNEIFTNHSLDKNTGIKYRRKIDGQNIEKYIDDPSLLQNPKLFEELSLEQLEELKEKLANDQAYQNSLKGFFTANDKVLSLRK